MTRPRVSLVFPVWNEEESLPVLYKRVQEACAQAGVNYEMVFVDNGSTDRSLETIKWLRSQDPDVTYVSLSRNFGHQGALFAGMTHAHGDAVVTMDADLQHPPNLIPEMVALWRGGAEVVYTTKRSANLGWLKTWLVKSFYWLISRASGLEMAFGQSDFRLLDRKVVDAIVAIPEYHKFLRGQVRWVGFRQRGLTYDVSPRHSGVSKFSYKDLFGLALDGLFAFSRFPLHIVAVVGLAITACCLPYMLFVVGIGLMNLLSSRPDILLPPGWATLTVAILFLGSVQLMAIGIVGEYVGRVYDQSKGRPVFIVRERAGWEGHEAEDRDSVRRPGQPAASAHR